MIKSYYDYVDTNIPFDVMMKFAMKAKNFSSDKINMATLPGEGEYIGGVSYFIPDKEESAKLVNTMFLEHRTVENTDK